MNGQAVALSVEHLTVAYGHIQAVRDVSFAIAPGEILTLIGANGAGKSSVLRAVSGMAPFQGRIEWQGRSLRALRPDRILGLGIAHVPEGRGIFGNLTVAENLALATWLRRDRAGIRAAYEQVFALFPRLKDRRSQLGGTLSGGEQQMLALGRALMSRARMLLLDEPSMGLAPALVRDIFQALAEINRGGTTMLLVEQNARLALRLAARACVLESGSVVLSGKAADLMDHPRVKEAYLGG